MLPRIFSAFIFVALLVSPVYSQSPVTSPAEQFGHNIGDDYRLVNYTQLLEYWKKLDQESDRLALVDIGKTAEGRPMTMAVITSAANHRNLSTYQESSRRLALAEGLNEAEARQLAAQGKAVVWLDGGLHANETLGAQQLIETVYQLAGASDPETLRILNDVIVLACIVNPDGMELVSNWYMREPVPERRSLANLPVLYQKYAGHDNNRDFYMSALQETRAVVRVLFTQWMPQIVYDHHQTAPAGAVMFAPPFRDPFNFNFDPLVMTLLDEVGGAMRSRFASEGKPGIVSRSAANYSAWWNGGLRTTPYFHNMIGLLTETIGDPGPVQIPFVPRLQLPGNDVQYPIAPQTWKFRQSIEYSLTANRAVLDYASRNKDRLLFNAYLMGRNSIERGSRDHWTITPATVSEAEASAGRDFTILRKAENRDPRGYVVTSDQPDFLTVTRFVNALIRNGITVRRSTEEFSIEGKSYPANSYIIKTDQAFRPHIRDMFEPQNYPNDFAYPGAPPTPPYDSAGWTLAYQMGVRFDRILDAFDVPSEVLDDEVLPAPGVISGADRPVGYLFTHEANDSFVAVNRLLQNNEAVYWLREDYSAGGRSWPAGTHYVGASDATLSILRQLTLDLGLDFEAIPRAPDREALQLRPVRIALWDRYGGSSNSGWARLVLEQFEFPYALVYARTLDAGKLIDRFDVLILVDDSEFATAPPRNISVPAEYADRTGAMTMAATVPQLVRFLEDGGTILAIGRSTSLGRDIGVSIADPLMDSTAPGVRPERLPAEKFYIPGSILEARLDPTHPIGFGLPERVNVFYDDSPAFRIDSGAEDEVRPIVWFDTGEPLRSGWAWGQSYLKDTVAVLQAEVGKGSLVLYGPEILFRAQSHGTFKLLFNGIYAGHTRSVRLR